MSSATYAPTAEQQQAIDLFNSGVDFVIEAGAGTGKTSTLKFLAAEGHKAGKKGQYLAFNRALVNDAEGQFPSSVAVRTVHSLAWGAIIGPNRQLKARLNGGKRLSRAQEARILNIREITVTTPAGKKTLAAGFLAAHVMQAVTRFCQSADPTPNERHFPIIPGIDLPDEKGNPRYDNNNAIAAALLPALTAAWEDITSDNGALRYLHEHYLKMYELSGPRINVDYILFDEAQDVSPVIRSIVMQQQGRVQLVFVGDSAQAIYGFTGATNAMAMLEGPRTYLSQSFRFGEAVADAANEVLSMLTDSKLRLRGFDKIDSKIEAIDGTPDVILCRTNAVAIRNALTLMAEGKKVAIADSLKTQVVRFAEACIQLQENGRTDHPELAPFDSWGAVQFFVETDPAGDDLRLLVNLVDDFGADVIIDELRHTVSEANADVTVTTAHTSKGREWDRVRLAEDFVKRAEGDEEPTLRPGDDELRLLYVAITRAKLVLDLGPVPLDNAGDVKVTVDVTVTVEPAEQTDDQPTDDQPAAEADTVPVAPVVPELVLPFEQAITAQPGDYLATPDYGIVQVNVTRPHGGGRRLLARDGNRKTVLLDVTA